jgi:hypothetical protein
MLQQGVISSKRNGIACKPIDSWFSAKSSGFGQYRDEFESGDDENVTRRLEQSLAGIADD